MTDSDFDVDLTRLTQRGVTVDLFTRHSRAGWCCRLDDVKGNKFTSAEDPLMRDAFYKAKGALETIWASQ